MAALGAAIVALSSPAIAGAAEPPPPPLPSGVVGIDAPIVVEALDDSIDTNDPELIEELEALHESFEAGDETAIGQAAAYMQASSNSGMSVAYDSTFTAPGEVQSIVNAAAAQWDAALTTNASGPIVIAVNWKNLGGASLLGSAGPNGLFQSGSLPSSDFYPAPLANTLLGTDVNGAGSAEVVVNLNSSANWYIGTGGVPGDKIDLYSVVLHEIGHGLGFLGSASENPPNPGASAGNPTLDTPPFVFDRLVTFNGVPLLNDATPNAHLKSNNLRIVLGDGSDAKIYAPPTWSEGSSFSHFDEGAHPSGTRGALMTPSIGAGQSERILDSAVLGVMGGIGWPVAPGSPALVVLAGSGLTRTVTWDPPQTGTATSYQVERSTDGANWVLVGSTSGLGIGVNLTEGVHQFRVRASNSFGSSPYTFSIPIGVSAGLVRPVPLDGQLSRLYQAFFLRHPDESGFAHWKLQRANGNQVSDVASAFASSPEFQARYGTLNNDQYVNLVYANVLGRSPDAEGYAHWMGRLNAGASKGAVMTGFSESTEFVARTGTVAPQSATQAEVYRLYVAAFIRFPDGAGSNYWVGQRGGGAALEDIAASFIVSTEFTQTYGSLPDDRFVEVIYRNVLGRTPDAAGAAYWRSQLAAGVSRAAVLVSFSQSPEFVVATGTLR